jgi:acyl-coenzyme A thioesterase PaaI-like protein
MPWPEPDWTAVEPFPFAAAGRAFRGEGKKAFVSLRYFERPAGGLVALAAFGPLSEGAPGRAHGGAVLTALDEALGAAAWRAGRRVLTARLTTEFRLGVPLGAELLVETSLVGVRHRLVEMAGRLVGPRGEEYASARGRFIELSPETEKRLFGPT